MRHRLLKILIVLLVLIGIVAICTITLVDRTPYRETAFYDEMDQRLDSLEKSFRIPESEANFQIGWSKVNITTGQHTSLAGYGARDPKHLKGVHDSSFVRTVVFKKGAQKAAFITADLLIIHAELSGKVISNLPDDWKADEIYFTATHTHSGLGGWAPGLVGKLFTGEYNPGMVDYLSGHILRSLEEANENLGKGGISYGEFVVDDLVKNRLVAEGDVDSVFRVLTLQKDSLQGLLGFYSAHATCLSYNFHELSGDYPALLIKKMENDRSLNFAAFGAGAVGSMGPDSGNKADLDCVNFLAENLSQELDLFLRMTGALNESHNPEFVHSFQLKVPLREPYFKLSENLAIRQYLFRQAFGSYQSHIRVLLLGKTILIGMPCDFSGELALPLYEKARSMGFNLIITSFNGDYMGYVIKDEWYDLPKYESRTMSWFGPDTGSYMNEIVSRILNTIHEVGVGSPVSE